MPNALLFILKTLFDLYVLTFVLRLFIQWTTVDKRNPLIQFILRITNPLVIPLRRILPPAGRIDTATVVALFGLQIAGTAILLHFGCIGEPALWQVLTRAGLDIVQLVFSIFTWSIIIYVVLSWVSPGGYNPATALIAAIVEPVLAPFRRLIPPIAGIDLSPLFALIGLQALAMLLPADRVLVSLVCTALVR
ncbi:MAG: YggT family protein [Gammaproteobacteria bacterium]